MSDGTISPSGFFVVFLVMMAWLAIAVAIYDICRILARGRAARATNQNAAHPKKSNTPQ